MNQISCHFMNLLTESELLALHFHSFSLRKDEITFLERRVSAFITLAEVFAHTTSKITEDTLFIRTHC